MRSGISASLWPGCGTVTPDPSPQRWQPRRLEPGQAPRISRIGRTRERADRRRRQGTERGTEPGGCLGTKAVAEPD
jgi:hypothetical protein